METINIKINNKEYSLIYCLTEEEKEKGLQNVESMENNEGAFFDYREDPQDEISFWMKDTEIPLDIIFVGEDDKVISCKEGIPNSEDMITENNVYYVIELNKGSGVKPGDEVDVEDNGDFLNFPPNSVFLLNDDGSIQFSLQGGERIFSRISSRVIVRKAKKAKKSKSETDYKDLGRYIFGEMTRQDNRDAQYVEKFERFN